MRVVVTGGAGFIGSALVRGLVAEARAESIIVVDNLSTGKRRNLESVNGPVEFHQVDIRDGAALDPLFRGADVVYHLAAIPSVPRSIREPEMSHAVNVDGTFQALLAAKRVGRPAQAMADELPAPALAGRRVFFTPGHA